MPRPQVGLSLMLEDDFLRAAYPLFEAAAVLAGTPTTIVSPDIGRTFAQFSLNGTARLGSHAYAYTGPGKLGRHRIRKLGHPERGGVILGCQRQTSGHVRTSGSHRFLQYLPRQLELRLERVAS